MEWHMDNEDKIEEKDLQVPDSKEIFLKDDAVHYAGAESYDLEKEFAKTKKNKSPFIWITIMLFVAVFAAAAILVTTYIQNRSKNVPVDIEDFADVNLKDVLDRAKQYENQLAKAERELKDLREEMSTKIEEIRQKAARDIQLIRAKNLAAAEENRQITAVQTRETGDIEAVQAEYEPLIAAKEAEIAEIRENLAEYDTQMVEKAKEQEELLNSQQMKFEIEMEEAVTYYEDQIADLESQYEDELSALTSYQEDLVAQLNTNHADEIARLKAEQAAEIRRLILEYNPIFAAEDLKAILAVAVGDIPSLRLDTYKTVLQNEGIISKANFDAIHENIYALNRLLERLQETPYINSVPEALERISFFGNATYNSYEDLIRGLIASVEYKNAVIYQKDVQLERYRYAMSSLIKDTRENGYILDPRDVNNIHVFLDGTIRISDGDSAYVFRTDEEMIAEIQFFLQNGIVLARLTEQVSEDKTMKPYDKILIQIE